MLLLLLSEVNNTTIFLMVLLNGIDRENRWSSYTATLLSLLVAIDNRPTRLAVMAWHHRGDLASWTTKPFGGTVTSLASISLASASAACLVNCCCVAAYAEWAVARTLHWRASALFVCQVHFRAHRSLLPIGQSPIRLIVVRSSSPSLTRRLSCGAWVPAKSGGDCWHNVHVLLGDVRTRCFVSASAIDNLGCHVAQPCRRCFSRWRQKSLWPTHLLRWRLQRHKLHCRQCDASLRWWGVAIGTINFIVSTLAPSQSLKVVAQLLFVARGSLLPCTAYAALRPFVARGYRRLAWHTEPIALLARGSLLHPAQSPILARGLLLPSLVRGPLWPSLTDASYKCRRPSRYGPYKGTFVPYDGTYGAPD